MKNLITLAAAGLPGAALAHPGHAELPGPMGHDIAHLVIGLGLATAIVVVVKLIRTRKEE